MHTGLQWHASRTHQPHVHGLFAVVVRARAAADTHAIDVLLVTRALKPRAGHYGIAGTHKQPGWSIAH